MMQKPWFKAFIWLMSTFFFFLTASVLISLFRPGPTESEAMIFMESMMSAMENSIMGVAMGIKHDESLQRVIVTSAYITVPIILMSIPVGIAIRAIRQGDQNV